MQRMFDKSYPDIQAKCQTAERRIVIYMSGFVFAGALYCYVKRMIFGMTENERKLSANSHNKANPEKQLPFLLWLPVDDTVSPMYYVTLAYNVLFTVVSAVMTYHLITYLPIICVHMQGSCETIARSLTQLGNLRTDHTTRDDLDRNGASKSRRNEIPLDLVHGTQMGPRRERINQSEHDSQIDHALNITSVNSASKLRRYSDPALSSLIAIIIQHQQFLLIRNQLQAAIQRSLLLKNFAYNIILTVSLYQLNSVDFADKDRFLQMIIQYLLMIAMSFSFTQSSELLDRGNDAIHEALTCGAWYNMRARVARLLIPMIRVSGRPKRLMYFAGTVDISYRSFVAVLKFSYSFFALLKNVI
uniref:Odorant receptor n=2 Tax=Diaphorina citri TaxID=121845 RepID=A0A7T3R147_DIACI|nr:odorant receptor 15 [Diaphorina citri]